MSTRNPIEILDNVEALSEGTPYEVSRDGQPEGFSTVYRNEVNEVGTPVKYPSALILSKEGKTVARRCAVADSIPKNLKKILKEAGINNIEK